MDPGAEKGYALVDPRDMRVRPAWDAPNVVAVGTSIAEVVERSGNALAAGRKLWACVEFQYGSRVSTGEISADSVIKLAFRAGYMLAEATTLLGADEHFAVVPQRWKAELFPSATLRKDVFLAKLLRQLMPDEVAAVRVVEERDEKNVDDVLDAIGIAWALAHVALFPHRWRTWKCDPARIIPIDQSLRKRKRFGAPPKQKNLFQPKEKRA
jgi:hypothetical protein